MSAKLFGLRKQNSFQCVRILNLHQDSDHRQWRHPVLRTAVLDPPRTVWNRIRRLVGTTDPSGLCTNRCFRSSTRHIGRPVLHNKFLFYGIAKHPNKTFITKIFKIGETLVFWGCSLQILWHLHLDDFVLCSLCKLFKCYTLNRYTDRQTDKQADSTEIITFPHAQMVPKRKMMTYVDFCKTKSIFWTCSKHLIIQECVVMSAKIEVPLSVSTVFLLKHPSFKPESNTNIV